MLTTDILDRDLPVADVGRLSRRAASDAPAYDTEARLRDLRSILRQARGRPIRPRGTYSKRSA